MAKFTDLTGEKFGRLTVIRRLENDKHRNSRWSCKCECGEIVNVLGFCLKNGNTKSCGCFMFDEASKRHIKHGHVTKGKSSPTYRTWINMIQRCNNPNASYYSYYGGRGINVCERWMNFENFLEDMGERPSKNHSIERKDSNGDYCLSNCKWGTSQEQGRNRSIQNNNKSGYKGIYKVNKTGKWTAAIGVSKKTIYIGSYEILEDAVQARKKAEQEYWGKSS